MEKESDKKPIVHNYKYNRKYLDKNGNVKEYEQTQNYILTEKSRYSDDLQGYISQTLDTAKIKVKEIKKIESILKTVLQYRGYNKKNLDQRIYRLEHADEINAEDKKLLRQVMDRQKTVAGDLTSLLTFILQLYEVHDSEIKELTQQLKDYEEK